MRRLLKVIVSIVVIIFVAGILAIVAVAVFANRAVKAAVESAGTKTLNVPVVVGGADASLLSGDVDLQNITVKNPPGYTGPALLTLGDVEIQTQARTLLSHQVVIKDMNLVDMEVFVEQKGLENNLYQVIKPLHESHEPSGRTLIIDKLTISNILVHFSPPALPGQQAQSIDLKIAPITMTELGRHERMDTAILISKIVLAVTQGIADQGSGILPKETISDLSGVLDKAIDLGRIIFGGKKNGDQTDQKSNSGDLGEKVTEGLKGLIGGKKKE